MSFNKPNDGAPGTTDQSPRWEGPQETRPAGYLPANDYPTRAPDAIDQPDAPAERKISSDRDQKGTTP